MNELQRKGFKDIRCAIGTNHSANDTVKIVLEGSNGELIIAELRRREGIALSLCYSGSMECLDAGKKRLVDDTALPTTTNEVNDLRRGARDLKAVVAERALELRYSIMLDREWGRRLIM